MSKATRVGGVLVVEIYVEANISKKAVQDMFTRAIAAALEVPVELVSWLTAFEVNRSAGSQRRLQDNFANQTSLHAKQAKLYEVAFEIIVPDHLDANEILEKAKRIAEPGSAESQQFREVLSLLVGKIASKVPAYKKSAPDDEDDRVWVAVLIGFGALILLVSCLLTTFVLVMRRRASNEAAKASAKPEIHPLDLL
jgi:hypothetical protein